MPSIFADRLHTMLERSDLPPLEFGEFQVNPAARTVHKLGVRLKLHRQPFEILLLLLARPGEVVTREELRAKLWVEDTFVDFEHSLNTAVKKLRQTLGDSASAPRFIETVPRIGYRFVAPLNTIEAKAEAANGSASAAVGGRAVGKELPSHDDVRAPDSFRAWRSRPVLAGIAIAILALAGLAAYLGASHSRGSVRSSGGRLMLAVLPFENLTGDTGQDYFSDGMTEEMIAQLGRMNPAHLGVIARGSAMEYKSNRQPLDKIGRDLGVEYVLEGSVRRDSQRVRVTAELVEIGSQSTIWTRQYDRDLGGILALQQEIAQEIADEIELALGNASKRTPPSSRAPASPVAYEAYDSYLKGRYFWNERNEHGFQQATAYFQQAIAKDPNYARAYAGLADSYALTASYSFASQKELIPKARAAALRALQLDDTLAEAHTSLALVAENYDWDWQTADKEFRRAIELDPNYPTAHQWYAECLAWQGRFDEALTESERARRLDPLSFIITTDHAAILFYSRQYDRAIEQLRTVLDLQPNFPRAHSLMLFALVQKGRFAEALAEVENWRRADASPEISAYQAYVYGRAGQRVQARRTLAKFEHLNQHGSWRLDPAVFGALAYAGTGDKEKFFASLQQSFDERSYSLTTLKVDPIFDPFRNDPRFQDFLRKVGLAQ